MTAFFLAERLFLSLYLVACAFILPNIRGTCVVYAFVTLVTCALWIGSIHLTWPSQLALIFPAIFGDVFGQMLMIFIMRLAQGHKDAKTSFQRFLRDRLTPYFEFYPAINIEHRVSRHSSFVTLVLGSAVLSILYQSASAHSPLNAFFGKAILGLVLAYSFNWIYFDIDADQDRIHVHAIRRHRFAALTWTTLHVWFVMGFILAAAALADIILARDLGGTEEAVERSLGLLGETFRDRSEEELEKGLRWYFCGGISAALAATAGISFAHVHKTIEHARLKKHPRLRFRVIISIIIVCLPIAGDRLSSVDLVAIVAGLVVLQVFLEVYGLSCTGDRFWTNGWCKESKRQIRYSARCPLDRKRRKMLEKKIKAGEEVGIEEILRMRRGQEGSRESLDSETTLTDGKERDNEWWGGIASMG
ncbi:MAG: hypothetical protein Q9227_004534 [Pyrenula ochraceoflavens]